VENLPITGIMFIRRMLPAARAAAAVTLVAWLAVPAGAQAPPRGGLVAGWAALEAGKTDAAVAAADKALADFPYDHVAITLKIKALADGGRVPAALDAWEAWTASAGLGDPQLLAVVAESVLRTLSREAPVLEERARALDVLASLGDRRALAALPALVPGTGVAAQAPLAAAGDAKAAAAIVEAAATGAGSARLAAIKALAGLAPGQGDAAIDKALADADPLVRVTAAQAAAASGNSGLDKVLPLLKDPSGEVRQGTALALAAAGRTEGDQLVDAMVGTGVSDLVLSVAEALPDQPARWEGAVRPLLEGADPIDRLRAARVLQKADPEAARKTVQTGLSDANPAVREEAARSLAALDAVPGEPFVYRLLADPSAVVRLEAARVVMQEMTGRGVKSQAR
jgi:HEAT repeat protein